MEKGKIVQVMGPVVDVEFEDQNLPYIKDALTVENNGKKLVMEVAQHIGNNTVRCIMLASSDGLCKDMEVTATGAGISVPVGKETLGRLFNVLGETIDNGEQLENAEHWVIHILKLRSWRPASRSLTFWHHMRRAVRSVCSAVPV